MKIGLSLSFCIAEVLAGRAEFKDIVAIVSNTSCRGTEEWNEVITQYQESYWQSDPEKGAELARQLIETGKVIQPRLDGHPSFSIATCGNWVELQLT